VKTISFRIEGKIPTQGSKKPMPIYKGKGKSRRIIACRVVDQHEKEINRLRALVRETVAEKYTGEPAPKDSRIAMDVTFYIPRPANHYGTGKNAGTIKLSARPWPTVPPDSMKMVRAIEDALTGILYEDDSQICEHTVEKIYHDGVDYVTDVTVSIRGRDELL